MKHCKKGRRLGRVSSQRKALKNIMAADLIMKEKIKTTQAKAKELRPYVEKLITAGKNNNLAAQRRLARCLTHQARKKLVEQISPRYQDRPGGYTRITKLGQRESDGAKMAIIEFVA